MNLRPFIALLAAMPLAFIGGCTPDETVERAARNIPGVKTTLVGTLNVYEILKYQKLILTKESAQKIEEVYV